LCGHSGKARARVAAPVLLATAATALCLAGPATASAAQQPAGTVLAWGGNEGGQLGDGSTTPGPVPVPVAVDLPARTRVIAIAAGGYDSLVLTAPISCRHRHTRPIAVDRVSRHGGMTPLG
jgi:hypothetical protein